MDSEAKKLFAGAIWAENGERQEIESGSIAHPIQRGNGFQIDYSEDAVIPREIVNQILCEMFAACKEIIYSIPPWDGAVAYPAGAITSLNGTIYHTFVGGTNINPAGENQTTWSAVYERSAPQKSVPDTISAANVFIDNARADRFRVYFNQPHDGNSEITGVTLKYSKQSDFSSGVHSIINYTQGSNIDIAERDSDAYYVRLAFKNEIGTSESASIKVRTNPLTPPGITGFTAQAGAATQRIDLSWNPVNPSNGLTISKYRVEWKSGTESFSASATPARHKDVTTNAATITGLTNGTSYTFRVVPVSNRNTENVGSYTGSATPVVGNQAPSKPSILAIGDKGKITLSATDIPSNNGSAITAYNWQYKLAADTNWTDATSTTVAVTTITGLSAGSYNVRMRAVNSVGNGAWSDNANATVTANTAPGDVHAYIANGAVGTVIASLNEDIDDGGSPITSYQWQYRTEDEDDMTDVPSRTYGQHTFSGLSPGVRYYFRLKVTNEVGTSESSLLTTIVPQNAKPSNVKAYATQGPKGMIVAGLKEDINDGGSTITSYQWQYKISTDENWTNISSSSIPVRTISNLVQGETYNFRVSATNSIGTTTSTNTVSITVTNNSAPSNVKATVSTGTIGSVLVGLAEDTDDGGTPITGYQWQYKKSSASDWTDLTSSTNPTQTISNLDQGSTYQFRVKATNAIGTTTSSTKSLYLPSGGSIGVPKAPTIRDLSSAFTAIESQSGSSIFAIMVTATTESNITINTSGYPITNFQWSVNGNVVVGNTTINKNDTDDEISVGDFGTLFAVNEVGYGNTSVALHSSNSITIKLRWYNAQGWGPWSNTLTVTPQAF